MLRPRIPRSSVAPLRRRVHSFAAATRQKKEVSSSSVIFSRPERRHSLERLKLRQDPFLSLSRLSSSNGRRIEENAQVEESPTSSDIAWMLLDHGQYPVGAFTWDDWDEAVKNLNILWEATKESDHMPHSDDFTGLVRAQHLLRRLEIEAYTRSSASRRYLQPENDTAVEMWFDRMSLSAAQAFWRFYSSATDACINPLVRDLALVHTQQQIVQTIRSFEHTSEHSQDWRALVLDTTEALVEESASQPGSLQSANVLLTQTPVFAWSQEKQSSQQDDEPLPSSQQLIKCAVGSLFRTVQHNQPSESLHLWKFCRTHRESHADVWNAVRKMLQKSFPGSFDGDNLEEVMEASLEASSLVTELSHMNEENRVLVERARKILPRLEQGSQLLLALTDYHMRLGQEDEATLLLLNEPGKSLLVEDLKERRPDSNSKIYSFRKTLERLILVRINKFKDDGKGDQQHRSSKPGADVDSLQQAQELFEVWRSTRRERSSSVSSPSDATSNFFSINPSWQEDENRFCKALAQCWVDASDNLKAADMFLKSPLLDFSLVEEAAAALEKAFVEQAERSHKVLQEVLIAKAISGFVQLLDKDEEKSSNIERTRIGQDLLSIHAKILDVAKNQKPLEQLMKKNILQIYSFISDAEPSYSPSRQVLLSVIASVESAIELNQLFLSEAKALSDFLNDPAFLIECIDALGVPNDLNGEVDILDVLLMPILGDGETKAKITPEQIQSLLKAASEKCLQWHSPEKALEYLENLSAIQGATEIDYLSSAPLLLQESHILKLLAKNEAGEALKLCRRLMVLDNNSEPESPRQGYLSSKFCSTVISLLASNGDIRCADVLVWLIQLYHQSSGTVECKPTFDMFVRVLDCLQRSSAPKGSPTADKTSSLAIELLDKMIQLNLFNDDSMKATEKVKAFHVAMRISDRTSDDVRFPLAKAVYEKSARASGIKPDSFIFSNVVKAARYCKNKSPESMEAQLKSLIAYFLEIRNKHKDILGSSIYSDLFRAIDRLASHNDPWMKGVFLACCQDGFLSKANRELVRKRVSDKIWSEIYESKLNFEGKEPAMWSRNASLSGESE